MFHGHGTFVYAKGDQYEGAWVNGFPSGKGRMAYADGSNYNGAWSMGKKHGHGTLTTELWTYTGEWKQVHQLPALVGTWGGVWGGQHPVQPPLRQPLGTANAETAPHRTPAAAAVRTQRPDATCEGKNG